MRKKRWQRVVAALASVTVFCTTYALILPAITMEEPTYCGFEEHVEHNDECYSNQEILTCTLPEGEGHIHDESCLNEDGEYICGLSEGEGAHQHDDSCREITTVLTCELPIHEHTLQCFSNPDADVENSSIWERTLSQNTGRYGDDVLAVAKSQLGYEESTRNYLVQADGATKNGYTRYGEWFGDPYGDWNCMFASFCVCYAGVPGSVIPTAGSVSEWIAYAGGNSRYQTAEEQITAGDIVFVDVNSDGSPDVSAVVKSVSDTEVSVIQGDVDGAVASLSYDKDQLIGYLHLTEEPSAEVEPVEEPTEEIPEETEETEPAEEISEETEETEPTEETPESVEEAEFTDGVSLYAAASDGAEVLVSGNLPEGAEVTIVPVVLSEAELNGYLGTDSGISVQKYVAYDITIFVNGEEWQPDETVSVTISRPAIQIDEKDNFEVAHVDSAGNTENVNAEMTPEGDVLFDTDGFSLYIIYTYTVDFHYSDFTYSIQGGDSILLSKLFDALGIDVGMADVVDVEFSDETLIRLEKLNYDDGSFDWRLFSLKAFDTDEELTVTLASGDIVRIHVTDALGDIVTPSTGMKTNYVDEYDSAEDFPTSSANDWQVVSQNYATVKAGDGVYSYSSDNAVRLQKAVIPTDTENEFQVYLNVQPRLSWMEFFKSLDNYQTHNKSSTFNPSSGVSRLLSQEEYDNLSASTKGLFSPVSVTYDLGDGRTFTVVRYGNFTGDGKEAIQNVPNGSYAWTAEKFSTYGLVSGINWRSLTEAYEDGQSLSLTVDMSSVAQRFAFATDPVYPQTVTDPMGQDIIYQGEISFDKGALSEPTVGSKGGTLVWTLPVAEYPDPPYFSIHTEEGTIPGTNTPGEVTVLENVTIAEVDGKLTAYYTGVLEGRYGISLDVSHSAAPLNNSPADSIVSTNGTTTLDYDVGQISGNTAYFPIPEVRGLLYDITFIKLNEEGRQLADAVFALYQSDGTTPVLDSSGNPMTVTTTATGISRFPVLPQSDNPGLPYGDYVLKETQAPAHYTTPTQNAWTIRLCYTDAGALLEPDVSPYEHNMRYTGNDTNGQWRITNPRKPFYYTVEVIKVDESGNPLPGAGFSVVDPVNAGQTLTGETDTDGKYLFDANFTANIAYILSEVSPPGGYFSLPANIQFRVDEDTSDDTYTVVFINSGDFAGTVSLNLKETGTGDNTKYTLEVTIQNQATYKLPNAGGSGTLIYTLSGILLLGTALMVGFCTRRKRERRAAR